MTRKVRGGGGGEGESYDPIYIQQNMAMLDNTKFPVQLPSEGSLEYFCRTFIYRRVLRRFYVLEKDMVFLDISSKLYAEFSTWWNNTCKSEKQKNSGSTPDLHG